MAETYAVSAQTLRDLITQLYQQAGMSEEEAAFHAEGLVKASLRGVDSHGVLRTAAYLGRIQNGAINTHPHMCYVKEAQALQVLDADGASGYTAGREGMSRAIELAREHGLGMVLVRNSNHFGAAALYAQMAVDEGMLGFSTTNVKPGVTAPAPRETWWETIPLRSVSLHTATFRSCWTWRFPW